MNSLLSGACAGFIETSICHPLEIVKTRLQNRNDHKNLYKIASGIYTKEGWKGFYRGLFIVYTSIIPKNAIRFSTFEIYNNYFQNTLIAGSLAGITESIIIVTPFDVCRLRLLSQYNSFHEQKDKKNVLSMIHYIFQKEGIQGFYKGILYTSLRQAINQSTNFFVYHYLKSHYDISSFLAGSISGAIGPILNNPLDVMKTRFQSSETKFNTLSIITKIYHEFGLIGFYKGLFPRLLRIVPGQGITFFTYDYLSHS
jgi:solute carrier family 25 citrate transporter 1